MKYKLPKLCSFVKPEIDYFIENCNFTDYELDDILPQYRKYCEVKREYQLGNTSKDNVIVAMNNVCKEITEFINSLYSHTDMQEERELLDNMLKSVM